MATNETIQYLNPNSFQFILVKLPEVRFTYQRVNIPKISAGRAMQNTEMLDVPWIGEKLTYAPLEIKFIVDQQMVNYMAIDKWLRSNAPLDSSQFGTDITGTPNPRTPYDNTMSDATLQILDSQNNIITQIGFIDCFPLELSGFEEGSDNNGVKFVTATAVFAYTYYQFILPAVFVPQQ